MIIKNQSNLCISVSGDELGALKARNEACLSAGLELELSSALSRVTHQSQAGSANKTHLHFCPTSSTLIIRLGNYNLTFASSFRSQTLPSCGILWPARRWARARIRVDSSARSIYHRRANKAPPGARPTRLTLINYPARLYPSSARIPRRMKNLFGARRHSSWDKYWPAQVEQWSGAAK